MDYKGKWAFIVGGSEGIGFSLAMQMLVRGCSVLIISRSLSKLEKAADNLMHYIQSGSELKTLAADASDYAFLKDRLDSVFSQGVHPHFLFNCAGRALPDYFENITPGQLSDTLKLNVLTVWNPVHICLPYMKAKGRVIMNTSSVSGIVGVFGYTDYSISKFGIIGFSESLRSEVEQHGIQVSVLCPPDTDTPGFENENIKKPKETHAISAGAKLMTADAVAKEALRQLEKGKFMIFVNFESKLTWWLKRWLPGLLHWIIQREVRKVA
jgi:short-subunit dehydrogenase